MVLNLKNKILNQKTENTENTENKNIPNIPQEKTYYGRKNPPPKKGSSYGEFIDWVTDKNGYPFMEEDLNLAINLWLGNSPNEEEYLQKIKL